MRRPLQLRALTDELDTALASLQAARRMLTDLMRTVESDPELDAGGPPSRSQRPPAASLRFGGRSVAQAAVELGIGEEQVRRLLRRGALEGVNYGGKSGWRLDPDYVREVATLWSASRAAQQALRAPKATGTGRRKGAKRSLV